VLEKILRFSINHRWLIMALTLGLTAMGVHNLSRLPIDAVPDITNVQVQINTEAPGYSPYETEQRITFPIETVMAGLPNLEQTRSLSRYGLSQVTVIFEDGTDIYFARQLVNERLQEVRGQLPPGMEPQMGPISTGLGEIYMWAVKTKEAARKADGTPYSLTDLREIQDWIIKPQLRTVRGVTEVNTIGGYEKQLHVTPYPERLQAYGLTLDDVLQALGSNNDNVGAGYIEKNGEQYLVRVPGQVKTIDEVERIVLKTVEGVPVYVRDVADVLIGKEQRTGAGTQNGEEVVIGTVFMLMGENSRAVSHRVDAKMAEIRKSLPEGVAAETVYDRTQLVDKTIDTVTKNLVEGALLVVVILFVFLGNIRAAIVTAMVIPLSMFFTAIGMVGNKISGNLMSLGALDFGLIVDGAVIIVENCIKRLGERCHKLGRPLSLRERLETTFAATKEVRQATMFGELIIMIVYLPVLTLTGVEGKMFYPMAFTVIAALLGAMVLSMTFVPAAVAILLTGKIEEKEGPLMRFFHRAYEPVQAFAFRYKRLTLTATATMLALCVLLGTKMGSEFIPSLDEGDVATHAMRVPGTSLTQSVDMQKLVEKEVMTFPEVATVFSKIGTPEVASDPMPPNVADTFIMLKPRSEWPDKSRSKADVVSQIEHYLKDLPGNQYEFTQPIQMRFNELISGVRSDVGIKVFGDDMDVLLETAERVAAAIRDVPGAADVKVEQVTGLPLLTVELARDKLSRLGLNTADVQAVVEVALGGKDAGKMFDGDRRFDLMVVLPEKIRSDLDELRRLPIAVPRHEGEGEGEGGASKRYISLGSVADLRIAQGPNQISREDGKRRIVVSANVRGRDLGSFVASAQRRVADVKLPAGYWLSWGGQFEQMISAARTLQIVVPVVLVLIFALLFISFGNVKDALLVFTGVPFALTGGLIAIWMRGIPLSISAGVGFIALSGVAVLNGLVMITFINRLRADGISLLEAARKGALERLRPVLMTAFVASLGFVPMALATGTGAEVQRPLATVVIGGIVSSTILTLVVLPLLYCLFHRRDMGAAQRERVFLTSDGPQSAVGATGA
jgi:cobalt-zinc-cadmium resistance protein CzcA